MIGPQAFALAHLALVLVVVVWAALSVRRARTDPYRPPTRRGPRYRRVSTEEVMRRLDAIARNPSRGIDDAGRP